MMHLSWSTAGLGLALAVVAMPAAGRTPETSQVEPRSAALPHLSVKVGTLELRDLTFNTPERGSWSIGGIGFTGFVRNGVRSSAERINIDNVVVTSGSQTIEIPSIVISGADFPVPLFRALTSGEATGDLPGLLASATVDRIAIDRIVQRDPSTQLEATHTGFVISGLKDGTLASARLAGSVASAAGAPSMAGKIQVRSGEVRYQQVDLAEMVRMITGGGSGSAKRLLQRAVVDGIDVTTDQATVRIKRVEVADVQGRAPEQPPPTPGGHGTGALNPEQQRLAAAYAGHILRFGRIGRYSLEGISVSNPQHGSLSIGAVTVGGITGRGIDRFELTGFDFRLPGSPVRFDRFEIEGITYGPLVDAALSAAQSGGIPDFSPARIPQLVPRASAIRLARLNAETPQGPIALGDLRFELEEVSDATNSNAAIDGLRIDLGRLDANEGRNQLMVLGYGQLVASAQARVSWLRKERAVIARTVSLSLDQVGRIEITARLDNVDIDKALADPIAAEDVMAKARLGPIEIRVANLGLAERFYAAAAKDAGLSPDTIRAGLAAEMRSQAIGNFGPLLAEGSADAVAAFLQSPGTITARIAPAAGQPPPTVAELQSLAPPELMRRFTITLKAGPP